jgi:hypothetical protein
MEGMTEEIQGLREKVERPIGQGHDKVKELLKGGEEHVRWMEGDVIRIVMAVVSGDCVQKKSG